MTDHREFFNNVSNDLERVMKGCTCGCEHAPKVQDVVTVALVNGEPYIYATEQTSAHDVLTVAWNAIGTKENR